MDYELASELKDAGFPQKWVDGMEIQKEPVYIPTLTELICECGEDFFELRKNYNPVMFFAGATDTERCGTGATAEIAVANLWLSLQNYD